MESPFFRFDQEVRFGSVDVDEGHQDGGHLDVRGVQDLRDKLCEIGVLFGTPFGPAESVVNHFRNLLDQMILSEILT